MTTDNLPAHPMPITVVTGTITITEGDKPPRTIEAYIAMPANTATDVVLEVFGKRVREKAALAAGLDELDALPTAEDPE